VSFEDLVAGVNEACLDAFGQGFTFTRIKCQVDTITLSGTSGTANLTLAGNRT
jgi:hypothetical protein